MLGKDIAYYINKSKLLKPLNTNLKIKIGLLSSFTINGLEDILRVECFDQNITCQTYVADYNQYSQEILNPSSGLYNFSPDITFVILDPRTILSDLFYYTHSVTKEERQNIIKNKIFELQNLVDSYFEKSNSKLVFFNFQSSHYTTYGISESKEDFNLHDMLNELNTWISNIAKVNENLYYFDFDNFVTYFGAKNIFNYREYFFGDIKISIKYLPYLVYDMMRFVKAILGLTKKCIVVDLDNTLWGGVIGEDGFEGIKIGNDPIGRSYLEFQKILLSLNQRGIILAVNSKNNYNDALEVIKNNPDMILRQENFATMEINWDDKSTNLQRIATTLNIGLDSMVFIDDDPVNCELVRSTLPQILTISLPQDPSEYASILLSLNDLDSLKITYDDTKRQKMYFQEQQRNEFKSNTNLDDFLTQLNIKLRIKDANKFTIPRISQLTLKTNQFNLTTKRYQVTDIQHMTANSNYVIGCAQVEDKFGDSGITGVYIIKKNSNEWILDTFLLSCRIMGRGIEESIISYILQLAKANGVSIVKGKYIPTSKNKPAENFFQNYGFKKIDDYWVFDLSNPILFPKHVEMVIDDF